MTYYFCRWRVTSHFLFFLRFVVYNKNVSWRNLLKLNFKLKCIAFLIEIKFVFYCFVSITDQDSCITYLTIDFSVILRWLFDIWQTILKFKLIPYMKCSPLIVFTIWFKRYAHFVYDIVKFNTLIIWVSDENLFTNILQFDFKIIDDYKYRSSSSFKL